MPPQSRGARLSSHSQSTPNLPTLNRILEIDNSVAPLPDSANSAYPLQAQRATTSGESERFPDLDGCDGTDNEEPHVKLSQAAGHTTLLASTFDDEEDELEDAEESETEGEEDRTSQDGGDEGHEEVELALSDAASGSDSSTESSSVASSGSTEDNLEEPTLSSLPTSAPSTLRGPNPTALPSPTSSADSSPKRQSSRPPGPNRSQSLYTQPLYTKSHGSIPNFHTSPSRTHLNPAAFAPPFYNRPPTPLPPSPSLTSLLRPLPFSTHPSRPTTPPTRTPVDSSSDTEPPPTTTLNSTAAHSTTSLPAPASAVPPAAPKIPTYEYYGFTLYVTSTLTFAFYFLWSALPTPFLHLLGIYYYPNRWWSLAVPAWLVMLLVWIYVALACFNTGTLTLPVSSLGCLVDEKGRVAALGTDGRVELHQHRGMKGDRGRGKDGEKVMDDEKSKKRFKSSKKQRAYSEDKGRRRGNEELDWRRLWSEGTDAVLDVPIGGVCEVLYGEEQEQIEKEESLADGGRSEDGLKDFACGTIERFMHASVKEEVEELDTG